MALSFAAPGARAAALAGGRMRPINVASSRGHPLRPPAAAAHIGGNHQAPRRCWLAQPLSSKVQSWSSRASPSSVVRSSSRRRLTVRAAAVRRCRLTTSSG